MRPAWRLRRGRALAALLGLLLAAGGGGAVWATPGGGDPQRARPDPMRPTPVLGVRAQAAGDQPLAGSATSGVAPPDGRLRSVLQLRGQVRRALIGERWVQAGERIADWQVVRIDEDAVQLRRGQAMTTLRLWPLAPVP